MYVAVQWQAAALRGTRVLGSLVLCCCVKQRAACWCDIQIRAVNGTSQNFTMPSCQCPFSLLKPSGGLVSKYPQSRPLPVVKSCRQVFYYTMFDPLFLAKCLNRFSIVKEVFREFPLTALIEINPAEEEPDCQILTQAAKHIKDGDTGILQPR